MSACVCVSRMLQTSKCAPLLVGCGCGCRTRQLRTCLGLRVVRSAHARARGVCVESNRQRVSPSVRGQHYPHCYPPFRVVQLAEEEEQRPGTDSRRQRRTTTTEEQQSKTSKQKRKTKEKRKKQKRTSERKNTLAMKRNGTPFTAVTPKLTTATTLKRRVPCNE